MYQFIDDVLYRKRPNGVKLKCIPREEGLELLAEIQGGICGSHIGSRALAGKTFRQGFFWPTALQDATTLVTKCETCQFHSKKLHQPAQALQAIPLSWPFSLWGLDILGSFPRAVGGFEYLYVAIDKFTKLFTHEDLGSKVCFASVAHPRSNGQAERANAEVLRGLRTKTFDRLHKSGRR